MNALTDKINIFLRNFSKKCRNLGKMSCFAGWKLAYRTKNLQYVYICLTIKGDYAILCPSKLPI